MPLGPRFDHSRVTCSGETDDCDGGSNATVPKTGNCAAREILAAFLRSTCMDDRFPWTVDSVFHFRDRLAKDPYIHTTSPADVEAARTGGQEFDGQFSIVNKCSKTSVIQLCIKLRRTFLDQKEASSQWPLRIY